MFVIIEGEFRSLIRNALERVIGSNFKKQSDKNQQILLKLSTRVISSLLAVYIFSNIKDMKNIKEYVSYIMIGVFLYFATNK